MRSAILVPPGNVAMRANSDNANQFAGRNMTREKIWRALSGFHENGGLINGGVC
jgi:hypothetical protein